MLAFFVNLIDSLIYFYNNLIFKLIEDAMKKFILVVSVSLVVLSGCATTAPQGKRAGDDQLSCTQIKRQIVEAKEFEEKAHKERNRVITAGKGATDTTLFWPTLSTTYSTPQEAGNAAMDRLAYLTGLYGDKQCQYR